MAPRLVSLLTLTTFIALASPISAKETKKASKKSAPTWKVIAEHVFKNGIDHRIPPQLSSNLGLGANEIPVKALRHKASVSPDKRAHAVLVLYSLDTDGKQVPREIVLSNALTTKKDDQKYINGFDARTDLNGKLLGAVIGEGPSGEVTQRVLPVDSPEAIAAYKNEESFHKNTLDYLKLSK